MQKISKATMREISPKRAKLSKFETVFYFENGELIEKYNWGIYSLLLLTLPLRVVLTLSGAAAKALSELTSEDLGRTKRKDVLDESQIEIVLKNQKDK